MSLADGKSPGPYLPHEGLTASRIFERRVCEISSEALPSIQSVHWTSDMTSVPGTSSSGSSSNPPSARCCHAEVNGCMTARTEDWILDNSESWLLGRRFPRKSTIPWGVCTIYMYQIRAGVLARLAFMMHRALSFRDSSSFVGSYILFLKQDPSTFRRPVRAKRVSSSVGSKVNITCDVIT